MKNHFLTLCLVWTLLFIVHPLQAGSSNTKDNNKTTEGVSSTNPSVKETRSFGPFKYPIQPTGIQKLLPDISVIGTLAGAYFSEDPSGETGHDPARTGFNLQEIELAIQSVIDPYLRGDVFLSFHEEGVELEEAVVTTLNLVKGLQIRAGKMLLPFGRQNQKHLHSWEFADNMLVNKYLLGPESLSELGIEVSYLFPTPFFLQLQGSFTNGSNETSFGGNRKEDFLYQGRLSTSFDLTPNTTLLLGGSAATGFNNTGLGNETRIFGGDLLLKWKPSADRSVSWQTEYLHRFMQTAGSSATDGGLYSYLDYQFLKRWHAGLRYEHVGLPEGINPREWRLSSALSFSPTEFSKIRAQYEFDKTKGQEGIHAAFLQLQFSMGPHGAHPF